MLLKGGKYLDEEFHLRDGDIRFAGDRILAAGRGIPENGEEEIIDCRGLTVVPGFIDVHIHGCAGANICDGTREAVDTMADYLIRRGVTSFCPTTLAAGREVLEKAMLAAKAAMTAPSDDRASVLGINMEGPFLSPEKIGAQDISSVEEPNFELFRHYNELSGGAVKMIAVAPELPDACRFIEEVKQYCTVSVAHTNADYDQVKMAFDSGASHATHLFNAMTGLHHRKPGAVGAVLEDDRVRAELICDGFHVHPAVLRIAFSILGDRALIVSDSMRAAGMPDGDGYEQGGQSVSVKNGRAFLADGTLAGSVTNIHSELKNLVAYGIPFEQAVRAATLIPARAVHMEDELGSIREGKKADMVLLDKELEIKGVIHAGKRII